MAAAKGKVILRRVLATRFQPCPAIIMASASRYDGERFCILRSSRIDVGNSRPIAWAS
jgi:hypothetical protein